MPPAVVKLEKPALIEWNGNKITDHNRSELSVGYERIESSKRMANGTLRKYVIADKHSFSTSWDELPHNKDWTVDGYWGGLEMETFYKATSGPFALRITNGDGKINTYQVVFTSFDRDLLKRGLYDFWRVSVEMEEI